MFPKFKRKRTSGSLSLLSFSPCSDGSGLRESIPEKIRLDFFNYINNKVLGEVVPALTPKTFFFCSNFALFIVFFCFSCLQFAHFE